MSDKFKGINPLTKDQIRKLEAIGFDDLSRKIAELARVVSAHEQHLEMNDGIIECLTEDNLRFEKRIESLERKEFLDYMKLKHPTPSIDKHKINLRDLDDGYPELILESDRGEKCKHDKVGSYKKRCNDCGDEDLCYFCVDDHICKPDKTEEEILWSCEKCYKSGTGGGGCIHQDKKPKEPIKDRQGFEIQKDGTVTTKEPTKEFELWWIKHDNIMGGISSSLVPDLKQFIKNLISQERQEIKDKIIKRIKKADRGELDWEDMYINLIDYIKSL